MTLIISPLCVFRRCPKRSRARAFYSHLVVPQKFVNGNIAPDATKQIVGAISGTTFTRPDVTSGFPAIRPALCVAGATNPQPQRFEPPPGGYPDSLSPTLKIGMFVPSTNTSMEAELWYILKRGALGDRALAGVGIHAAPVITPKPDYSTPEAVQVYNNAFAEGLQVTLKTLQLAEPEYLIMGMSFEAGSATFAGVDMLCAGVAKTCGMGLATWQWSIRGALETMFPLDARGGKPLRVGVLTPFNESGNRNACAFFGSDHFPMQDVARSYFFDCATTLDIAHVPDDAKRAGIRALVGNKEAPEVDVIIQGGTNCTLVHLAEEMERECGVPVLGVNAVLLWYALRENGINGTIDGVGRLFREH